MSLSQVYLLLLLQVLILVFYSLYTGLKMIAGVVDTRTYNRLLKVPLHAQSMNSPQGR